MTCKIYALKYVTLRRHDVMLKLVIFKMARLTSDQRIFIVKRYYEIKSVTEVQRKFK